MRLFWISLALLLYANLAHAVKLGLMSGINAKHLAPAPVDNIEGSRCSDAVESFVDAPKGLRESDACKEGSKGFMKHTLALEAVSRKSDIDKDTPNKPYMCCVDTPYICNDEYGFSKIIELVPEKDINGKERKTTPDCSNSKPCRNPKKYFCIQEAVNNPSHYHRTDDATLLNKWIDLPLCCPKHKKDETCDYPKSDFAGEEPNDDCDKYFGRCKADNHTLLCSKKKHDKTASSCCKPHKTELCPGGIYPFGLKGTNGLVDWVAGNSGDEKAWKEACLNLATKPEFANASIYIFDGKCCAKAKLNAADYYGQNYNSFLTDKYERLSTTACKNDTDCGKGKFCGAITSSYNIERAMGNACFEKIHCPHKTKSVYPVFSTENVFTCSNSTTCPNGTICIWGKPAAATAAKIKKAFGMCCSKADYETEMCTAEFLGNPHNMDRGKIDPTILSQENCTAATQKWGPIDTGARGAGYNETHVCCQYKPLQFHNETCTAVIMGNRKITGKPIEDANFTGRYLSCDKEKKRMVDKPKIDCGEKLGFCFADPGKPNIPGVCCDTELCSDGLTALSDVSTCDDNCMWNNSSLALKEKYCVEDKNKIKKCCPPKFIPEPDGRSGRYESNAPNGTEASKTNVTCTSSRDCGGYGTFCNEKEKFCYRLGTRQYDSNKELCAKAADCEHEEYKNYTWWCVAFGSAAGDLYCTTPTEKTVDKEQPRTEQNNIDHIPFIVDMICLFGSFLTSIAIVSLIYVVCHVGAKWKTAKMAKKAAMATTDGGKATGKGATTGH